MQKIFTVFSPFTNIFVCAFWIFAYRHTFACVGFCRSAVPGFADPPAPAAAFWLEQHLPPAAPYSLLFCRYTWNVSACRCLPLVCLLHLGGVATGCFTCGTQIPATVSACCCTVGCLPAFRLLPACLQIRCTLLPAPGYRLLLPGPACVLPPAGMHLPRFCLPGWNKISGFSWTGAIVHLPATTAYMHRFSGSGCLHLLLPAFCTVSGSRFTFCRSGFTVYRHTYGTGFWTCGSLRSTCDRFCRSPFSGLPGFSAACRMPPALDYCRLHCSACTIYRISFFCRASAPAFSACLLPDGLYRFTCLPATACCLGLDCCMQNGCLPATNACYLVAVRYLGRFVFCLPGSAFHWVPFCYSTGSGSACLGAFSGACWVRDCLGLGLPLPRFLLPAVSFLLPFSRFCCFSLPLPFVHLPAACYHRCVLPATGWEVLGLVYLLLPAWVHRFCHRS